MQSRFQDNFVAPNLSDPRLASKRAYRMLIDGRSVDAQSGETITRESPGHRGKAVGEWPAGGAADAALAITAARRAFDTGAWPRMSGAERSTILHAVAAKILEHVDELGLIECLETGKPLEQAKGEIGYCADLWNYAAGQSRGLEGSTHNAIGESRLGLVLREPAGVVGIITPWNFPFIIVSERVPWALGTGCTVVVKPSEFTSGTTIRLAELAIEAGLPAGAFNVITGYGPAVGQVLAEDPRVDVLAFTGSVRVGTTLAGLAAAGVKRVGLELGGKGPQIVFADADLDAAADGIAYGVYHNAGQCCISGSRLIVENSIRQPLLERVLELSRRLPFGDPLGAGTRFGAMVSRNHLEKVASYVAAGVNEGAELLLGGDMVDAKSGNFFAPTVFDKVRPDMAIAQEEIFGPVLATIGFDTPEEAVALANGTPFGLSASVWSRDLENAIQTTRKLRAGRCWINSVIDGTPELPIGGYKKSGTGRELGRFGFDEYSQFKGLHMTLGRGQPWFQH
ncbi:aldehyde dehydrogenase family protein [Devosia neptuniae]|uniref:Aldehyde dehydrogenase family protein n=1 Tax=Devosia neptuniae TaxID=191302 RepID=A0ABY6CC36_9HYPH|nr:aldehyde dehydrogenase family protein [Devosia neptuniae]UXN69700.1 aldehyde dehydrogenase family protein [Devosia neptuniae]